MHRTNLTGMIFSSSASKMCKLSIIGNPALLTMASPPSKVLWRMVLQRPSWYTTCLTHTSFCLSTVARRDSSGPIRKLISQDRVFKDHIQSPRQCWNKRFHCSTSHNWPLNVLGTPSCRQAMYMQAEAMASLLRPFSALPSWTCLKSVLARSWNTWQFFL